MVAQETTDTKLDFYFDPGCPWAWRTFQWIKEVRGQTKLDITWKFFALATVHDRPEPAYMPLRVAALVRQQAGNEMVERFYQALGAMFHEERRDRREPGAVDAMVREALQQIGCSPDLLEQAVNDPRTLEEVKGESSEANDKYGIWGVPWLILGERDFGLFGPVIDQVPQGKKAEELWGHIAYLLTQPHFFELKRDRN